MRAGCSALGELRRHVQLRTAAIIVPADAFADPLHVRVEFGLRVGAVSLRDAIPLLPELLVLAFEERADQIVLGSEVAVETGLGNARPLYDKIDADGACALTVKQVRRRLQDALLYFIDHT